MSETPRTVRRNVEAGRVRVSQHAMQELPDDGIDLDAVVTGVAAAVPIEDYPDYVKGPCVLCLQKDETGPYTFFGAAPEKPPEIATIITAYGPDPDRWMADMMTRKPG